MLKLKLKWLAVVVATVVAAVVVAARDASAFRVAPKSYACVAGICELQSPLGSPTGRVNATTKMSQGTCLMTCGNGSLWPYPTGKVDITEDNFAVIGKFSNNFVFANKLESTVLNSAVDSFYDSVHSMKNTKESLLSVDGSSFVVNVQVTDGTTTVFSMGVDESYTLTTSVQKKQVTTTISAETVFGARHAIETLSQLVSWDSFAGAYVVASSVHIQDGPEYVYRGVMLDLSRHFVPISNIKQTVRALSYNKMNVLHLHVADSSSFPILLEKQSNISYHGAYSETDAYTLEDLRGE
jgi:hexosaminidase